MSQLVSIPIAIFDMAMEYTRPNMKLLIDRIRVVDNLFENYRRWDIKVDDVEVITEGKPSEQGVKFKIPSTRTSFFFGAGQCRLTRDDADWESAHETIEILKLGLGVLNEVAGVEINKYKTSIALHIQPDSGQFLELLRPFAPHQMAALDPSPLTAFAAVTKWEKRRVTIDGSAQLANAIFLKFERDFAGTSSIEEIAHRLRADEDELFAMLGIQEIQ
jgi:hypothetical protein